MESPFRDASASQGISRLSYRPKDAAAALGVSESTLRRFTAKGEITAIKRSGVVLYAKDELQRWLASSTEESWSENQEKSCEIKKGEN